MPGFTSPGRPAEHCGGSTTPRSHRTARVPVATRRWEPRALRQGLRGAEDDPGRRVGRGRAHVGHRWRDLREEDRPQDTPAARPTCGFLPQPRRGGTAPNERSGPLGHQDRDKEKMVLAVLAGIPGIPGILGESGSTRKAASVGPPFGPAPRSITGLIGARFPTVLVTRRAVCSLIHLGSWGTGHRRRDSFDSCLNGCERR